MKIKELRVENNKTQTEIAGILGISRQVFANYEKEINFPDPKMLIKLADYFNVSIDYLVGRTDDEYVVPTVPQTEDLSARERELLNEFRRLGPFEAEAILIQIRALAGEKSAIKK